MNADERTALIWGAAISAMLILCIGMAIGASYGYSVADQKWKEKLAREGVASYEVNQYGEPVWKYQPHVKSRGE